MCNNTISSTFEPSDSLHLNKPITTSTIQWNKACVDRLVWHQRLGHPYIAIVNKILNDSEFTMKQVLF